MKCLSWFGNKLITIAILIIIAMAVWKLWAKLPLPVLNKAEWDALKDEDGDMNWRVIKEKKGKGLVALAVSGIITFIVQIMLFFMVLGLFGSCEEGDDYDD